jgi:hypothetical protein
MMTSLMFVLSFRPFPDEIIPNNSPYCNMTIFPLLRKSCQSFKFVRLNSKNEFASLKKPFGLAFFALFAVQNLVWQLIEKAFKVS